VVIISERAINIYGSVTVRLAIINELVQVPPYLSAVGDIWYLV